MDRNMCLKKINSEKYKEYKVPIYEDYVRVGNEIWFSAADMNGLFSLNVESRVLYVESIFEKEGKNGVHLHSRIFHFHNKIICVPFWGKNIAIYDIKGKSMKYINVRREIKGGLFLHAIQVQEKIYMIPCRYPQLIMYDCEKERIKRWDIDKIRCFTKNNFFVFKGGCIVGEDIYLGTAFNHYIVKYNLKSGNYDEISINLDSFDGITHLVAKEKNIYGFTQKGKWFVYNIESKLYSIHNLEKPSESNQVFYNMCVDNNYVYLAGGTSSKIYQFDLEQEKVKVYELNIDKTKKSKEKLWYDIAYLGIEENDILIKDYYENKLLVIDKHKDYISKENELGIIQNDEYLYQYMFNGNNSCVNENDNIFCLDRYIEYLIK